MKTILRKDILDMYNGGLGTKYIGPPDLNCYIDTKSECMFDCGGEQYFLNMVDVDNGEFINIPVSIDDIIHLVRMHLTANDMVYLKMSGGSSLLQRKYKLG